MSFVIGAAGTGGHVFPGLAVAEGLEDLGARKDEILFVGGDRLEKSVYPNHGYQFLQLELRGLKRELTLENLRIPGSVLSATRRLAQTMRERGVRCSLGMGGYVTVSTALASRRAGVPFFNAEQNAEAGLANRITSRFAVETFVSFPETGGLAKGSWVGNPVRRGFWEFDRDRLRSQARLRYGVPDGRSVVGIFGGSLGAEILNEVASEIATNSASSAYLIHLTGRQSYDASAAAASANWFPIEFEDRMDLFFAACDLVVARAGGAVAEITATATPAVLVPGEFGSGGHQQGNARFLERSGAAIVVRESDRDDIAGLVASLLADESRLRAMAQSSHDIAKPDAARTIASKMMETRRS